MEHRHLNHQDYTLAAIDDIIGRGGRADWSDLLQAIDGQPCLKDRVMRVCLAHERDEFPQQRYRLWRQYVEH